METNDSTFLKKFVLDSVTINSIFPSVDGYKNDTSNNNFIYINDNRLGLLDVKIDTAFWGTTKSITIPRALFFEAMNNLALDTHFEFRNGHSFDGAVDLGVSYNFIYYFQDFRITFSHIKENDNFKLTKINIGERR